ncbi:hypothetical protein CPB85DRAFT_1435687 [Mucidula mucida]|nr:hypothetical protein CPB85DRAFT_1435687 [Mucidula mucida]
MTSPNASIADTDARPASPLMEDRDFFVEDDDDDEDAMAQALAVTPQNPESQRQVQPPAVKPTPNVRDANAAKRNSAATRARTAVAAPAGTFCVLTQEPSECATVHGAHVVPRSWQKSEPERIRSIEYYFGYPDAKRLNLDTRFNIMFLIVLYHMFYDHHGLIFLPPLELVDQVLAFTLENERLALENKKLRFYLDIFKMPIDGWRYRAIAVMMSKKHSIFRKTLHKTKRNGTVELEETDNYRRHKHPFNTLPWIHSHVHPFFIILNAWITISRRKPLSLWTPEQQSTVTKIEQIVTIWLSGAHESFKPDLTLDRVLGDPEEVEDDAAYRETTPHPPLDPEFIIVDNLSMTIETTDSPPTHSSPSKDYALRRAALNHVNAEAGPSNLGRPRERETSDDDDAVATLAQNVPPGQDNDNVPNVADVPSPLRRSKRVRGKADAEGSAKRARRGY